MTEFQVQMAVDEAGATGTLQWQGSTDQESLNKVISLAADDGLIFKGLHRVEANISAEDQLAILALQKAGFRCEGRRRQVFQDDAGNWHDALLYSRLIDDIVYGAEGFTSVLDSVTATHRIIGHVLFRDENDRILLVEPTYKDDWELPGGIIEANESPRLGAIREIKEELGLELDLDQPLVVDWMPPYLGWRDAVEFIFDGGRIQSDSIENFHRPEQEIKAYHWVNPEEIPQHVTPISARRLKLLLEGLAPAYTEAGEIPHHDEDSPEQITSGESES